MRDGIIRKWASSPWYAISMVILAVIAILLTVLLTPRGPKRALELAIDSEIALLAEDPFLGELSITYLGQAIRDLTKMEFTLANTGTVAISEEEVKQYPTVLFSATAEVILSRIMASDPQNIGARLTTPEDDLSAVTVEFPLLNPGDSVRFCVYIAGRVAEKPSVQGRIAGVQRMTVADRRERAPEQATTGPRWYEILFWSLAGIGTLGIVGLGPNFRKQRQLKKSLAEDPQYLRRLQSTEEMQKFIDSELVFLESSDRERLLTGLQSENSNSSELIAYVRSKITEAILHDKSTQLAFLAAVVLIIPGLIMLILRLAG